LSKPRGYDDSALVNARVSKLARWRCELLWPWDCLNAVGGIGDGGASLAIWKVNEPRPDDAVDISEAVDIPSIARFAATEPCGRGAGELGSTVGVPTKSCASGERGGVRIGRLEMGDGGTKGNDSKMESARVELVMTDESEIRRERSGPPCSRALA
jgi:hypothetical protein